MSNIVKSTAEAFKKYMSNIQNEVRIIDVQREDESDSGLMISEFDHETGEHLYSENVDDGITKQELDEAFKEIDIECVHKIIGG